MTPPRIVASRRETARLFIPIAGLLVSIVLFAAWFSIHDSRLRAEEVLEEDLGRYLGIYEEIVLRYLEAAIGDVRVLARSVAMENYLVEPGDRTETRLGREFASLAEVTSMYDQIRFIDAAGDERIRVNYGAGRATIVPDDELQNKAGRYYFEDIITLSDNTVYVSVLDLNVEHDVIELPEKPMIRIGIPVASPQDGTRTGILLVNVLAKFLIDELAAASLSHGYPLMLLNEEGDWLHAEDETIRWGFMYFDRVGISFASRYPDVWEYIQRPETESHTGPGGIFVYRNIDAAQRLVERAKMTGRVGGVVAPRWYIVSHIDTEGIVAASRNQIGRVIVLLAVVAFASIPVAVFLARAIAANQVYRRELEAAALYDPLTRLPNRLLFSDRFMVVRANAVRRNEAIAIFFVDLDRFKAVNDQYGHDAGDKLLVQVSGRLKTTLRGTDTVARIGGDEFVVLLGGCHYESAAVATAEKLRRVLLEEFDLETIRVTIGASIGVCLAAADEEIDLEEMLRRADSAMYSVKRAGRGAVSVWRDHPPSSS